jgi:branched-subunit amino acid ABC-type transport system permease component
MHSYRPPERIMLLVIVIGVVLVGFAGLMGYMMYLTPGPSDRLE